MNLRVALQMDPVESLNPERDSSLLIGLEAQRRGHALYYYTPDTLSWQEGTITARAFALTLHDNNAHYFDLGPQQTLDLATMDVVWIRQDPPFDMAYISTTYLLEMLPRTRVFNHPAAVRNFAEKLFPLWFAQFMPPTLITADTQAIDDFRTRHPDVVIKPLYGHGGHGIYRARPGEPLALPPTRDMLVVQRFLPEVTSEDRRIILIDGEIGGIMGRIPAAGEIRANFRVGGSPARAELTARQRAICAAVGPKLKEVGIVFAGLDVIGDWLTEINITSPTGLKQMNALNGTALEADIWNAVEASIRF